MITEMKTEPDKFFQMRTSESFVRDLDRLRKLEDDLPSRADMLRRLVERALHRKDRKTTGNND